MEISQLRPQEQWLTEHLKCKSYHDWEECYASLSIPRWFTLLLVEKIANDSQDLY